MLSLVTQAALLAIVVSLASAAALVLKDRRPLYVRFAALSLSISAYYLAVFLEALVPTGGLGRVRLIIAGTIVVTASLLFEGLLGETGHRAAARRRNAVVVACLMAGLALTPWGETVGVGVGCAGLLVLTLGTNLWQMEQRARRVELAAQRARLRYLAVGGAIALLGGVADGLPLLGVETPALGGVFVAIYLYFLSQALMKLRLLDLHELLGKAAVLSTLGLILASIYGLLVVWVGDRPGLFFFNTLVASAVILILFEPLRSALEQATTRLFFKEQLDFTLTLRALVREIASLIEVPKVTERALDVLYDTKRVTHCSVYLLAPDGLSFRLVAHRGPRPSPIISHRVHATLFSRLDEDRSPLMADVLVRRMLERQADGAEAGVPTAESAQREQNLIDALEAMRSDLTFPIVGHDRVVGLLNLRDERLAEAYSTEEIALLGQLAEQMAISVENSQMFERLKERDRLAALGEMAAGLAHEIRNPLGAIKSAAQYLAPSAVEGDEGEFLQVIIEEVNRLNHVVSSFLDYARPYRGTFVPFDMNDALLKTVMLLKSKDIPPDVRVRMALGRDLPRVTGDAEQIRQVIINLILNAVQAMEGHGRLLIATRPARMAVDSTLQDGTGRTGMIELRVKDNGPGVAPENLKSLFIPFFTTKEKGTGLGLAICHRIVQAHGGSIEVRSKKGKGAEFIVKLPVALHKGDIKAADHRTERPDSAAPAQPVPQAPALTGVVEPRRSV